MLQFCRQLSHEVTKKVIYIYIFSRNTYYNIIRDLQVYSGYNFFFVSTGNRTHNLCTASAML